ncbi:MAG: hypothetical protein R3F62_13365 [Planctomycetota bacterium]
MQRSKYLALAACVACVAWADELSAEGNGATIKVEKARFASGDSITFSFTAPADLHASAWFGLVPSGAPHGKSSVNDRHDVSYHYVGGKTSGSFSFTAPAEDGSYDIRLSDHASVNDRELVSLTVQVGGDPWEGGVVSESEGTKLRLDKATFTSRETFVVLYRVPAGTHELAWAGIVPSDAPHGTASGNDSHDVGYAYLKGALEGRLELTAPGQPGKYDVRISDHASANDKELGSISFEVVAPVEDVEPTLALSEGSFQSHTSAKVAFTVPQTCEKPWIGVFAKDVAHSDAGEADRHDLNYAYVTAPKGEASIRVPGPVGSYEFRLFDRVGAEGKELAVVAFEVTAPQELIEIEPALELPKLKFVSHEALGASFKAPIVYDYSAWIGVVPSEVEHGTSSGNDAQDRSYEYVHGRTGAALGLRAPGKPGKYDLRLHDASGSGKEVAHLTFEVVLPEGGDREPKLTVAGTTFEAGATISVTFEAPAWFQYRAWVGLIPSEVEHGSTATCDQHDVSYAYVNGRMQATVELRAPEKPGSYDVRLLNSTALGGDGKEYASVTVEVTPKK